MNRELLQVYQAQPSRDGDGVRINRIAGPQMNRVLDPFLMIDEINSDSAADYIGGFPEHPHRGFETITYMKAGRMRHRDHMGNAGVIGPGDVQWMTAGRGVLHSEMPEQEQGLMHGFQLWLNLPAAQKLKPAAYRDIRSSEIARCRNERGSEVRVIAGEVGVGDTRLSGCLPPMATRPLMADVSVTADSALTLDLGDYAQVWVYVYAGASAGLEVGRLGVFGAGETLALRAGEAGVEALVLSGEPLREPIVQYGPFVMNHSEEIEQALRDYQQGRLVS
ncbi:MAG: pirin family protein [Halieaceae bacterium]|jgi:redox-sensitive bicupin YhaK (pirin superfamily)|nr:pirin family protein [Halieaceae bacterium]